MKRAPFGLIALASLATVLAGCSSGGEEEVVEVVQSAPVVQEEVKLQGSGPSTNAPIIPFEPIIMEEEFITYEEPDGEEIGPMPEGEYLILEEQEGWLSLGISNKGFEVERILPFGWTPTP